MRNVEVKNSLQFELWQECNSLCKYCYLGTENRSTPDFLKIKTLDDVYEKISDMEIYKGDKPVDALSYLGGEFFQGQLNTPEIKEKFMKVMKKTAELLKNEYIKQVWVYATMTIGDQKDLYEMLDLFDFSKGQFWLLTSYDTIGRFHTQKMLDNWEYHVKNIQEKYPKIRFNTTMIVTQDLINRYLNDEFTFNEFSAKWKTSLFFKQCGWSNLTKAEMNARMNNMFFPTRESMLSFLMKFYRVEGEDMYDRLFNINYRADNLYRNFNNTKQHMELHHRFKDRKNEEKSEGGDVPVLPCGHLIYYAAYSDSDECVLCDKEKIQKISKI